MSEKKNDVKNDESKVMTKYDLKMERRKAEKAQEKREKVTGTVVGVLVVGALAAWVVSLPVRSYLTVNGTYITVNDEKITRVEYDYNYYQTKANYLNQYGSFLSSYMGVDISTDFSNEMYSQTMTWGDFFDEMTVDSLKRTKALEAQAKATGFVYDPTEEYDKLYANIEEATKEAGISVNEYLKTYYGPYATKSRIEDYIKNSMISTAYYNEIMEQKTPSDETIESFYQENKDDYDCVDYYLEAFTADLPTEPTELADADAVPGDEENPYQPSDAEKEKAMADAKALAEEAKPNVKKADNLVEGIKKSSATYVLRDWLFDASRKAGDSTIIEDSAYNRYYVLSFVKRYRDETPSVDIRVVMLDGEDPQPIFDEWKNGEATEDSFATLCDKYSEDLNATGGLYEKIQKSSVSGELGDWLFAKERKAGDAEIIQVDETYTYIVYYKGQNKPEWNSKISESLTSDAMTEYLEEITANVEVKDSKNNLKYIKIREQEAADAAAAEASKEAEEAAEAAAESDDSSDSEAAAE